jgi:tRNA-specific adenosine deaminase 1
MKCLPQNKISQAQGVVLHDWHAEVLAIRAFNRFLLDECHALAVSEKESSEFIRFRSQDEMTDGHLQPFALNEGVHLHMYCSEAPCKMRFPSIINTLELSRFQYVFFMTHFGRRTVFG